MMSPLKHEEKFSPKKAFHGGVQTFLRKVVLGGYSLWGDQLSDPCLFINDKCIFH